MEFFLGGVPIPPHVLVDFVVLPPGHGSSVTDIWGWDAHEAQLRCPDVSGDIGGCSARGPLNLNSTNLPRPWSPRESYPFKENSHSRAGNRTRNLMISSQRLWPLDHEAGPNFRTWVGEYKRGKVTAIILPYSSGSIFQITVYMVTCFVCFCLIL